MRVPKTAARILKPSILDNTAARMICRPTSGVKVKATPKANPPAIR